MSANYDSPKIAKSCSSKKSSLIDNSLDGAFGKHERWSVMIFFTPFLSQISRSNF